METGGKIATLTTTQPAGRFGALKLAPDGRVDVLEEKARKDQSWVNAGFMVLNREIFKYLGDGSQMLVKMPRLKHSVKEGELAAYKHNGFWSPMDTVPDREYLKGLWESGKHHGRCGRIDGGNKT